jgi:hypothetical protein
MHYVSCPTDTVSAPVEIVWALLSDPADWGQFFDLIIKRTDPPGPATVGQIIQAGSGPRFLHLNLTFEFVEIDPANYRLRLNVRLPFGITVREDLNCVSLEKSQCRVNYHCDFSLPMGWRGALLHLMMRRELDTGPKDSLSRLKQAAERRYADSLNPRTSP